MVGVWGGGVRVLSCIFGVGGALELGDCVRLLRGAGRVGWAQVHIGVEWNWIG